MVYNFLGIDEKTEKSTYIFDQNIHAVYSDIHAVYPNKKTCDYTPYHAGQRENNKGTDWTVQMHRIHSLVCIFVIHK